MVQNSKMTLIFAILIVAVVLQFILAIADCRDTPTKAAIAFSKDYFLLNEAMADRLCSELTADEDRNAAKEVILSANDEARSRGFELGMVRRSLSHIETEILSQDEKTAEVKLTALSRVCINPVFAWVASLFKLGETQEVEAVISLIKEDGSWKACAPPFGLGAAEV